MYADEITDAIRSAMSETERRREIQMAYNEAHGITPATIEKEIRDLISELAADDEGSSGFSGSRNFRGNI